jgi:Uma2 family endonuclease
VKPILVIEILSPANEAQTRANIRACTTIPSVREILAVNSAQIEAELLRQNADGTWPEEPDILAGSDKLTLVGIDFATELLALYRTTALI